MAFSPGDILGHMDGSNNQNSQHGQSAPKSDSEYLRSIDNTLKKLLNKTAQGSMSNAAAGSWTHNQDGPNSTFRVRYTEHQKKQKSNKHQDPMDDFFDSFEKALKDGVLGSDFDNKLKDSLTSFAEALGVPLSDVPKQLGTVLGKEIIYELSNWNVTAGAFAKLKKGINDKFGNLSKNFGDWTSDLSKYLDRMGWRGDWRKGTESTFRGGSANRSLSMYQQAQQGQHHTNPASAAASTSSVSIQTVNQLAMQTVDKLLIASVNELVINSDRREDNRYPEVNRDNRVHYGRDDYEDLTGSEGSSYSGSSSSDLKDALIDTAKDKLMDKAKDVAIEKGKEAMTKALTKSSTQAVAKTGSQAATKAIATKAGSAAAAKAGGALAAKGGAVVAAKAGGSALLAAGGAAGSAFPPLLAAIAVVALAVKVVQIKIEQFKKAVAPLVDGWKGYKEAMTSAANRVSETRQKNQELANERFSKDVETIIKKPFEILENAAERVYEAWDANLRTINQTQGYNKSQLSELIGNYAQRLRDEGLSRVVNAADITDNLSKVLESGLSGTVAEEFAYLATKLNAAIPTQDFFGYANSYAEIVANATLQGKSQSEAISAANQELLSFANNLLYVQRMISGGVTTGLQDGAGLFGSSVRIANIGRAGSSSAISGVITTVASVIGGIAPDLAGAIVDVIESAATGGNSSELVALRSLAGINAGNTEFLQALVSDPQKTFTQLFRGLGSMQNMSEANYMEVAEGLSDIFGVSIGALARVDFNYLADAISEMNLGSDALQQNLQLLASGQSTLTAEQLRSQQINQYMLDEGLTYVLDNEAARAIQQHMWDEQIAREMMQAEYGVNLQGKSLQFLEGISTTIQNILDFLNPLSWMKKLYEVAFTAAEASGMNADIAQVLTLGAVGGINVQQLQMLTQRNMDYSRLLTLDYVGLLGGISSYQTASLGHDIFSTLSNPQFISQDAAKLTSTLGAALTHKIAQNIENAINLSPQSAYGWNTVGKTAASYISAVYTAAGQASGSGVSTGLATTNTQSATQQAQQSATANFNKFVETMKDSVGGNMSFEEWLSTASKHGISSITDAMYDAGVTENDLRKRWQQQEAAKGTEEQNNRYLKEQKYRDDSYIEYVAIHKDTTTLVSLIDLTTNPTLAASLVEQKAIHTNTDSLIAILNDTTNPTLAASLEQQKGIHSDTSNILKYLKDPLAVHIKSIDETLTDFFAAWNGYWIERNIYDAAYNYSKVQEIQQAEKGESTSAIFALAQALTSSDTELKDPLVQQNALLSQILIVAQSILQQTSKPTSGNGESLWSTLQGLALGGITQT